jgi:3-oxoadipate enol-lactonase
VHQPKPVLMLHAAGRTPQMWQSQVEAIGSEVSVLAPWLAGLRPGKTAELSLTAAADEVLALMDRNGIEAAHLVGHQLGAMVALQVATTEPSMVAGLVLSGAMVTPSKMVSRWQRTIIRLMPNKALAESGATRADLIRAMDLIATADFGQHLNRVTAPALVIAGVDDPARMAGRELVEGLNDATFAEVAGAGAHPNLEAPEMYNLLLLDFLQST